VCSSDLEFTNLEAFDFDNPEASKYRPYKVHFKVTVEPGWYTRFHQYDAIADVRFGAVGARAGCSDYRVVSVAPTETAQTIDQLTIDFVRLAAALEASGTIEGIGVQGLVQQLVEKAEKLEGLRTHKTMVVGFPGPDRLRVRFRAAQVATEEEQDLQPLSRLLTAVVLVPEPLPKEKYGAETTSPAEFDKALTTERGFVKERQAFTGTTAALVADLGNPRPCVVSMRPSFEPALRDRGGDFRPHRRLFAVVPVVHRPLDRHVLPSTERTVEIPPWQPDVRRPFEVVATNALYRIDLGMAAIALRRRELADARLTGLLKKIDPKSDLGKEELERARTALEDAEKKYFEALERAVERGVVDVGYRITAPKARRIDGEVRPLIVEIDVAGLSRSKNGDGTRNRRERARFDTYKTDAGEREGTLVFTGVDLSSVFVPGEPGYLKPLRALLEVRLVAPRVDGPKDLLVESKTVELSIHPNIEMKAPTKKAESGAKPITIDLGSFDPKKLDLAGLGVDLKTVPKPKEEANGGDAGAKKSPAKKDEGDGSNSNPKGNEEADEGASSPAGADGEEDEGASGG
ncbi:MAG: hypothetical protein ACF8XB_13990, partial [Planctomycetota bacterium JB042]